MYTRELLGPFYRVVIGQGLVSVFVGDNQVQIVSKGCKAMLTLFMALNNSTVFEGQNAAKYFQETIGCKSF